MRGGVYLCFRGVVVVGVSEPWLSALVDAGFVDRSGVVSLSALARAAGVHTSTVSNMVSGRTGRPSVETVRRVAGALGVSVSTVGGWVGLSWGDGGLGEYVPPVEACRLSRRQRAAVDEIIRCMVAGSG